MNLKNNKYSLIEITDKTFWNNSLLEFSDANLYQTFNYANVVQNEKTLKHIAIYCNSILIGMVQVRIKTFPILNRGIAYIFRGPVWQKKSNEINIEVLSDILNTLRKEFTVKQKLLLRIRPFIYSDSIDVKGFLTKIGPNFLQKLPVYKTLILDLNKDLSEIRKSFRQNWRNHLNKSEKNGIHIVIGSDEKLFDIFLELYNQMINRKKFKEFVNVEAVRNFSNELDDYLNLKIFIAYKEDIPISGIVLSAVGDTAISLFRASNSLGMKLNASYLLQFEMIKWLKENGTKRYDLGGIDSENNPHVYDFKSGITTNEVTDFGIIEASGSKISGSLVKIGEYLKDLRQKI